MLSPVEATGEDTLGALHYEGLRRGIIFFAALPLLILPGVVAAGYGRSETGFAETRRVTHLVRNALHPYDLRVEGDEIQVDVGPIKAARSPA